MKLILHIGTPRTDTKALQRWFATHRDGLTARGVRYARAPGAENHRDLMLFARDHDPADKSLRQFGITSPETHEAFRRKLADGIAAEVAANGDARVFVMSNEQIFSRITSPQTAGRLRDLLTPLFDEITVYLHLRPQVDLMMSNASQLARDGKQVTQAEFTRPGIGPNNFFYGYDRFVQIWEKVFGAGAIRLVPFRRDPDMTAVLIRDLGLTDAVADMTLPDGTDGDVTLDWRAMALANTVNRGLSDAGLPQMNYFLDTMTEIEPVQPGRALAQDVQRRFDAANAALAVRRSDITHEDLTPDWSRYTPEGNLHLIEAPCVFPGQIAQVIHRYAQELALAKWQRAVSEGKLAALQGDDRALQQAQRQIAQAGDDLRRYGIVLADGNPVAPA